MKPREKLLEELEEYKRRKLKELDCNDPALAEKTKRILSKINVVRNMIKENTM